MRSPRSGDDRSGLGGEATGASADRCRPAVPGRRRGVASVRPAAAGGLLLAAAGAAALTGCETTQVRSARLELDALKARVASQKARRLGPTEPGVRVVGQQLLATGPTAAVVVELENGGGRTLRRLPVVVRLRVGGAVVARNDTRDADADRLWLPVVPPGRTLWLLDRLPRPDGVVAGVRVGRARERTPARTPAPAVVDLRRDGAATVSGRVRNVTGRRQAGVPVTVVERRGGRIVAAGTTRLARPLRPRRTAAFRLRLLGDPGGGRLEAAALPTALRSTRSSR